MERIGESWSVGPGSGASSGNRVGGRGGGVNLQLDNETELADLVLFYTPL